MERTSSPDLRNLGRWNYTKQCEQPSLFSVSERPIISVSRISFIGCTDTFCHIDILSTVMHTGGPGAAAGRCRLLSPENLFHAVKQLHGQHFPRLSICSSAALKLLCHIGHTV